MSKIGNQVILRAKLLLKNKIQPGEFEDLIGFIKGVVNRAASHLVSRGELQRATEREGLLKTGEGIS